MTDIGTAHPVTRIRLYTVCTHLQQAQTTQLPMRYMFTPQKAQTNTQQSAFFSVTPLRQPAKGAVGHQKRPGSRPDQPLGLPAPAGPPSPACSSQRLALAGSRAYLGVMTLLRNSRASSSTFQPPGVTEGGVRVLYRSHLPSGPRTHNRDSILKFPPRDHQTG